MAGKLFIVGGGMDAHYERIVSAFIAAAGGENAKIAMVVTASGEDPDDLFRSYQKDFVRFGAKEENVRLLPIYAQHVLDERGCNALTGDEPSLLEHLEGVTGLWFTGGDQYFTAQCFLRADCSYTRALERMHEIYESGGVVGGTSAGAAIMSRTMLGFGNNRGVIAKDTVFGYGNYDALADDEDDPVEPLLITMGLGFFRHGIVDQHFNKRPRLLRLIEACLTNEEGARVGFAVSEDTALLYDNGKIEILGAGGVYLVDCRSAQKTGKACYAGVVLHVLYEGDSCDDKLETLTLVSDERPQQARRYRAADWVNGLTTENPAFSELLADRLLFVRAECLPTQKNKPFCKGLAAYGAGEKTYLSMFTYSMGENTKAYFAKGGLSFTNVELNVETAVSELRF